MKAFRNICIFLLVISLMLVSAGTVFANGPSDKSQGQGPQYHGKRQGFSGNVTSVYAGSVTDDGNVTLITGQGWTVTVALKNEFRFKIPKVLNRWELGNITDFSSHLDDGLGSLVGRRVVVLAYNIEETTPPDTFYGDVLKFMVLPVPGEPLHAHHAGIVTDPLNGDITIVDVHGVSHPFIIDGDTFYRPQGIDDSDITTDSFVTVITTGGEPDVAKAIVLHKPKPEGWPWPKPGS
jgi:hypothetical protein